MNLKTALSSLVATLAVALATTAVFAVSPTPLENAYWRFEEGTSGQLVPQGTDIVPDGTGNGNHMERWTGPPENPDGTAPRYSSDVCLPYVPATGLPNSLSLLFVPHTGGGDDIYAAGKDLCNPLIGGLYNGEPNPVTAFTLEATFKATRVGHKYMTVVGKESMLQNDFHPTDTSSVYPPLALKMMASTDTSNPNKLCIELRDHENNVHAIPSLEAIEAGKWYHAVVVGTTTDLKFYLSKGDRKGYVLQGTDSTIAVGPLYQGRVGDYPEAKDNDYESAWSIGKGMWDRGLVDWFDGLIDEVRITNQALNPNDFLFRPQPRIGSVLVAGASSVVVKDVHPLATAVNVYDVTSPSTPVLLGTNSAPGGNETVIVAVSPVLVNGQVIAATQIIDGVEGPVPPTGPIVGDPNQLGPINVGWAAEGMTSVVIGDIIAGAGSVTVYVNGGEVKTVSSPFSPIQVVTDLPAFVKDQIITARQTYQGIVGNLSAERRVTGSEVLEDFQTVATGAAPNTPVNPSQRVWYGVGDGITTVIADRTDIDGTSAMAVTDHGWTNGVYAVYRHVFPAAGEYHLEMQMWVDERDVDTDFYMNYQVGVLVNGAHRAPATLLAPCPAGSVADYTGPLTTAQDGVGVDGGPFTVLTPTISAQPGDDLLIVFSTSCTSTYMVGGDAGGTYPGMQVDNIKIHVGPKPCSSSDVGPVGVAPYDENTLLVAGSTGVKVTGARMTAKSVQVYEYTPPPAENWRLIGTATGGSENVLVNLTEPLYAHEIIVATQTLNFTNCQPAGDYEGDKPKSGPVVGMAKNSALKLSLGIREVANPVGGCIIGDNGGMTGQVEWIYATGKSTGTGTPQGGYVLQPSYDWQTVTFNRATDPVFGFTGDGVFTGPCYTMEELSIASGSANSGAYTLYIDNVMNGSTVIEDFDTGHLPGDLVLFQKPYPNPQLTPGYLQNLITPPNVAEVVAGSGVDGSQCLKVKFQFHDEESTRWFRLVTASTTTEPLNPTPNPIVDLNQPVTLRIKFEGAACHDPFADADGDGDVDQADFAAFQACFSGSGVAYPPGCDCYDSDGDNDVDSDDAGDFEACASGPGVDADETCDN